MFDRRFDPFQIVTCIIVACFTAIAVAEEDAVRRTIVFDGEIQSNMPPISIDHGVPVWDSVRGIERGVDEGLFDEARNGLNAGPWRPHDDFPVTASVVLSGLSRDGTEPRVAIFDRARLELSIWNSADTSGPSDRRISMRRPWNDQYINDTFAGTEFEQAGHGYRIASGTMLPGCMLFMLQHSALETSDDGSGEQEWVIQGVTIAALQESVDGEWEWTDRQDMPDPVDPEAHLFQRGYVSSMSSYYPTERTADFKEAFVPLVDYMGHKATRKATGGQCGIFRVRREQVGDAWSLEPLVEIHSRWQNEGEHFHVAGWTPNGVVLAIGDGVHSRVALLRCGDWENYTDLSNWTVIPRWQGVLDDSVTHVACNQFWGCCPSNEPNRLLCGGDNVAGGIFGLDVPEKSSPPPVFEGLIGVQPGLFTDGLSGNTVSWLHRSTPEIEGPIVARQVFDPSGYDDYTRVLLSIDGDAFATVARLPDGMEKSGVPFLVDGVLRVHRYKNEGVRGIFSASTPSEDQIQEGLMVRPGCVDVLRDDLGGHRPPALVLPASGLAITRLDRNEVPFGLGEDLAPDAVVYRVSGAPSSPVSSRLLSAILEDPRDFERGGDPYPATLHMKVCNLLSSKLRLLNQVDRGGLASARTHSVVATREWSYYDVWTSTQDAPATCSVTISAPGGSDLNTVDFLLMFRSLTEGVGMPDWPRGPTPGGVVPPSRISQPLPIRGGEWKVDVQMQLPPEGIDYSLGARVQFMPLCTFEFGPGRFVRARWSVSSGSILIDSLVGDQQWDLGEIHGLRLNRGDTIDVTLARREGAMRFSVVAAGSLGSEPAEISIPITHEIPPSRFMLGDEHHALVSALILRRISVASPSPSNGRPISPDAGRELAGQGTPEGLTHDGPRGKDDQNRTTLATERSSRDLVFDVLVRLGEKARHRFDPHDADGDGVITFLDVRKMLLDGQAHRAGRSRRR